MPRLSTTRAFSASTQPLVLLPVTLLAALAATQTFTTEQRLVVDGRAAAICAAAVAVLLRAPFLLIVGLAAATAGLVRLLS